MKANCKAKAHIVIVTNVFLNFDFQRYKKSLKEYPSQNGLVKKIIFLLKFLYFLAFGLSFTTISDNYLSLQLTFWFIFDVQRSVVIVTWNTFLYFKLNISVSIFKLKYWHKINWINIIKSTYSACYIIVDDLVQSLIFTVLIQAMKLGMNSTLHEITWYCGHQRFRPLLPHLIFSGFSI